MGEIRLKDGQAYMVRIICPNCGRTINKSMVSYDHEDIKQKYYEALEDPMMGYCPYCGVKGKPQIVEVEVEEE